MTHSCDIIRLLQSLVVLLVVLAGCSALPVLDSDESPRHSISISVSNNDDEGYLVRVVAVPPDVSGIDVTCENGSTHHFDVTSYDSIP